MEDGTYPRYRDRKEAGKRLAPLLIRYANRSDVVVLGLPRGGIPVAFEVAQALRAPLDVFVVRKLGVPGQEELAMGAVASGGVRVLNDLVIRQAGVRSHEIEEVARQELEELARREHTYHIGRSLLDVRNKIVILVDDGLATGATMRAAIEALRSRAPAKIVVAVPVGTADTCEQMKRLVEEIICARRPARFYAVGAWYEYFPQIADEEVQLLLAKSSDPSGINQKKLKENTP